MLDDMSTPIAQRRDRFVRAQLAGDRASAVAVVAEALADGVAVADVHLDITQWAQRRIGELWQDNRVSIAQEHVATAIALLAMSHLFPHWPRAARNGRKIVLACVEGELHDMGPRMLADFLEMAGYDVVLAGANVPTDDLVALVKSEAPSLVALSASLSFRLPALRTAIERLRAEVAPTLPIAVGGHAFTWSTNAATRLPVDVHAADAEELAVAIDAYFANDASRHAG